MKRKVWLVVFLLILSLNPLLTALCGDVNSNGTIDIFDALMSAQFYVGLNPLVTIKRQQMSAETGASIFSMLFTLPSITSGSFRNYRNPRS